MMTINGIFELDVAVLLDMYFMDILHFLKKNTIGRWYVRQISDENM